MSDFFNKSVLADYEIDLLCTATHRIVVKAAASGMVVHDKLFKGTDLEADQAVSKAMAGYTGGYGNYPFFSHSNINGMVYQGEAIKLTEENFDPMISPFVGEQVREELITEMSGNPPDGDWTLEGSRRKIISYGLSSFGYDFRVAPEFKVFTNINSTCVDPLNFDEKSFVTVNADVCIVPPNSFVLARTVEKFCMPDDVVGVCTGKSTIARSGLSIMVTPLEPAWQGYLTLEYANTTPLPVKLYANMGGGQIMFYRGNKPRVNYRDRGGKYQHQGAEVVPPRV